MTDSFPPSVPPGWYYAEGDPPGTQRYWDGTSWLGGPQAATSAGMGQQGYVGQAFGAARYTESSQAAMALGLGIAGLLCCGLASPVAWYMAQVELTAIKAGRRDPAQKGLATAALVVGILGCLVILGFIMLVVLGVLSTASMGQS